MKRLAVLLYPDFSNYEMSVALSVCMQGGKPFDVFALEQAPVMSEEGLSVMPAYAADVLDIEQYDALLLTGEMDCAPLLEDARYETFVRQFTDRQLLIGSISSSTALLAKIGVLHGRKYRSGIPVDALKELGFQPENMVPDPVVVQDGNLITAKGAQFIEFGVTFGEALGLSFDPAWYGKA